MKKFVSWYERIGWKILLMIGLVVYSFLMGRMYEILLRLRVI